MGSPLVQLAGEIGVVSLGTLVPDGTKVRAHASKRKGHEFRIMKTSQEGFQQCYNAQIVVDAESQLIVTTAVGTHGCDQGQFPLLLDAVQGEWNLVCLALNAKRLHRTISQACGAGL